MNKTIIILMCLIEFNLQTHAQQATVESKDGESSLIFPNAGITFNTTDPKITVSYYYGAPKLNLKSNDGKKINKDYSNVDPKKIRKFSLLAGGAVAGKNEDGIAPLFKDGEFTPGGEFSTVIGFSCNLMKKDTRTKYLTFIKSVNDRKDNIVNKDNDYKKLQQAIFSLIEQIKANKDAVKNKINLQNGSKIQYADEIIELCQAFEPGKETDNKEVKLKGKLEELERESVWSSIDLVNDKIKENVKNIIQTIPQLLDADYKINELTHTINSNKVSIDEFLKHTIIPFVSAKYTIKEFTRYLPDNIISSKFSDITNSNGYLKFHLNYICRHVNEKDDQINYHMLGLSIGPNWKDNYDALKSVTIQEDKTVYKDSVIVGKTSRKRDAKQGNLYSFRNISLDLDYLFIKNFENYSLMFNPYLRSTFALKAQSDSVKTILTDDNGKYRYRNGSLSLGAGLYFVAPKNIFIGGFFCEYAAISSTKPELDTNGNSNLNAGDKFKKNFSFGIVTKINFFKFRQDQLFTSIF